jgi:ribonuclease P protein component
MIPQKNKIPKKYFPGVLKGKRFMGDFGDLIISPSLSGKWAQSSIIIGKKYAKKAVTRNILKRQYFRVFAQYISQLPLKTFVYILKKPYSESLESDFPQEITKLIKQVITFYEKNN